MISYDIQFAISYMIFEYHNLLCATTLCQVKAKEQELKHKLRPANAFLKAKDMNLPAVVPREELHQFLIGVYGEYVIPSCLHSYMQVLRALSLSSLSWSRQACGV